MCWTKEHQVILSKMVGTVRDFLWHVTYSPFEWSVPQWSQFVVFLEPGSLKLRSHGWALHIWFLF